MKRQYQVRVYGRVQGVGFRYAARNQARALQLKGWVKNCPDGSVNFVINGEEQACIKYLQWCKEGSPRSWVEKMEFKEMKLEALTSFRVVY